MYLKFSANKQEGGSRNGYRCLILQGSGLLEGFFFFLKCFSLMLFIVYGSCLSFKT